MNKKVVFVAVVVAGLVYGIASVMADTHGCSCKGQRKKGLDDKFFYKAHAVLMNEEELGLSPEQVGTLKELKHATKKALIQQKAEIELIVVDINAALWQDSIDVEAVHKLVDTKYELKKEKAKALIEAYARLKNILSAEQKAMLKGLWKKCALGKK